MNHLFAFFQSIRAFTVKLLHLGVREDMSFFEQQKIHLLNIMILPALLPITCFALINWQTRPGLSLLNMANVICYLMVIGINIANRFLQWRLLFIAATAVIFFCEALFYSNGMEFALLLTVICSLVLVDNGWQYLLIMLSVVGGFCYLQYQHHLILQENKSLIFRVVSTIGNCLLMLTAGLYYFRGIYLKYHQQVETHKRLLELQQKQLLIQKQELEQSNKELKALSDSRQKILFTLAHDLRNPLSGIEALTNSMLEGGAANEFERNDLLNVIATTANRSLKQMQELLDVHRYNEPGKGLDKTELNLQEILQLVIIPQQHKAAEKAISIQCMLPDEAVSVYANKWQLIRVMENLLVNAIKFSHPAASIIVGVAIEQNWITLFVRDFGIGISIEKQAFIFDNVARVQQTGTKGEKSFGLGLSICRQIVEAHSGSIAVRSAENEGAEFLVKLPRQLVTA